MRACTHTLIHSSRNSRSRITRTELIPPPIELTKTTQSEAQGRPTIHIDKASFYFVRDWQKVCIFLGKDTMASIQVKHESHITQVNIAKLQQRKLRRVFVCHETGSKIQYFKIDISIFKFPFFSLVPHRRREPGWSASTWRRKRSCSIDRASLMWIVRRTNIHFVRSPLIWYRMKSINPVVLVMQLLGKLSKLDGRVAWLDMGLCMRVLVCIFVCVPSANKIAAQLQNSWKKWGWKRPDNCLPDI